MTLGEFSVIFGKLALQLRATEVDEPMIRSYFEPLSDLPLEAVRMAQEAFSRESGRKWFPTTAEWRERAQRADTEALRKALPPARTEPWKDECKDCHDTGWVESLSCDGTTGQCGRRKLHLSHSYTFACPCRATNHSYQRSYRLGKA